MILASIQTHCVSCDPFVVLFLHVVLFSVCWTVYVPYLKLWLFLSVRCIAHKGDGEDMTKLVTLTNLYFYGLSLTTTAVSFFQSWSLIGRHPSMAAYGHDQLFAKHKCSEDPDIHCRPSGQRHNIIEVSIRPWSWRQVMSIIITWSCEVRAAFSCITACIDYSIAKCQIVSSELYHEPRHASSYPSCC